MSWNIRIILDSTNCPFLGEIIKLNSPFVENVYRCNLPASENGICSENHCCIKRD